MFCKFKNIECRKNLVKSLIEDWNNNHIEELHLANDYYDNREIDWAKVDILFDENLHVCQPERSKREDSTKNINVNVDVNFDNLDLEKIQYLFEDFKMEMRCSEHCGNTVRDK